MRRTARHPVFLLNASGHLTDANRKAFKMAGVPPDGAHSPGGEFVRDGPANLCWQTDRDLPVLCGKVLRFP